MKHAMYRLAALALALCLMLTGAAAEEMDYMSMMPLVDLTASAAMRVGDVPESISGEKMLSPAFVHNFFLLGQTADASLGITPDMMADTAAQEAYLKNAFSAPLPPLEGIVAFAEENEYIGVQLMASSMSETGDKLTLYGDLYLAQGPISTLTEEAYLQIAWLSHRAVIELHRDAAAPGGWKINTFAFEPAIMPEDAGPDATEETMAEYVNAELGFSLQYPAVFTEVLQEKADGVSAVLADGSASFYARRRANEGGDTLQSCVDALSTPDAAVVINDVSQTGRVMTLQPDGKIKVDLVIVTGSWIYEAQLCYAPELADTFARYSDFMTNSFMADELGIG